MMRNRAKCLICGQVIEGKDNVRDFCLCKSLWIEGAEALYGRIGFHEASEVVMIDEDGKERPLNVINKKPKKIENNTEDPLILNLPKMILDLPKTPRENLLKELKMMIEAYENMPAQAKQLPINLYDLMRYMIIIEAILLEGK